MTTIAYKDGVLAADTGVSSDGARVGYITKIARRSDQYLAGASGDATYAWGFLQWFLNGCDGDPPKGTETERSFDRGVIFSANGAIQIYEPQGTHEMRCDFYAMGSGSPEARGAMWAGASAEESIRAAIALDSYTFGDITVLRHEDRKDILP